MSGAVCLGRRAFLQLTGLGSGALLLGWRDTAEAVATNAGRPFAFDAFLSLDTNGVVRIVAHRSEMGQGIRTALPLVVADEMEADWGRVEVVQARGDERFGSQDTDGSHSVRDFFEPMRKVGATARHMLVAAAAQSLGVDPAQCEASGHRVLHRASGRSLGYGELAERAAAQPVPDAAALKLKPRESWRYIGKARALFDVSAITRGTAIYGIDAQLPGMLHASIERCPALGGHALSFDAEAALRVPGVRQVVPLEGPTGAPAFKPLGGIAVVADHTWAAIQGRKALAPRWELGANGEYDSESFRRELETAADRPGKVVRQRGDVEAALRGAARRVSALYYAPHLSQSPLEPPAALAAVEGGRCEIWACTQNPVGAKKEVAESLGIRPEDVTVNVTLLGGGFGRKSKPDFIVEAALLSRKVGRPVKVTWTREDDIRHGYYHSVSAQRLEAGLDERGRPVAWLHRSVFPPIGATFDATQRQADQGELDMGLVDVPFDISNLRCENGEAGAHVRIGWLRSVANIYHAFAVGSFADELAHAAGADPKDYLLGLIGEPRRVDLAADGVQYGNYGASLEQYPLDTGRLRGVVERVAREAGWGRSLAKGRGLGIAAHRSFLTYVAIVIEVSVDAKGELRVEEVHAAFDCGTVVNRDTVESQVQGAVVFGLSGALDGRITARAGRIEQSNFHDYPPLRIKETPRAINVHIVDSDRPPAGVGEPGVPPVAPALANAIFAATGERRRELPLRRPTPA